MHAVDELSTGSSETESSAAPAIMLLGATLPLLPAVLPFTRNVRAEIDNELTAKSINFMKRSHAAGKPFFLYLPFSMGHFPNTATNLWKATTTSARFSTR